MRVGFSLVAVSGGCSSLWCAGFSLRCLLLLGPRALGAWASVVVAHRLSCSTACGIFPDQGSNPCLLHWQADSQPPCHQGSPKNFLKRICEVNFKPTLLNQIYKILSCRHAISRLLMRYFTFFFHSKSANFRTYFTLPTHFHSDQPHFKCSLVTCVS